MVMNEIQRSVIASEESDAIIRYSITGKAAHARISPLLPLSWMDCTYSENENEDKTQIDFIWENALRRKTRKLRDSAKCYSHLPNGTKIMDSKWVLSRLLSNPDWERGEDCGTCSILESHCFLGSDFRGFAERLKVSGSDSGSEIIQDYHDLILPSPTRQKSRPDNTWVIKDADSNGAGGIWFLSPLNVSDFLDVDVTPLNPQHKYVAQKYADPLVLYQGRKCHIRVYALLTSDGMHVHRRCFLHVANEKYSLADAASGFEPSVHITNCCANSDDPDKFAGEILADLECPHDQIHSTGVRIHSISKFAPSIDASLRELARRSSSLLGGGSGNGGFEYLGCDFLLSTDEHNHNLAYLLEVNAPPSQDTATGLPHAEELHSEVLQDLINLWVMPNVCGVEPCRGGWKQVWDSVGQESSMTVPSKAVLFNRIKWMILERRLEKRDLQLHSNNAIVNCDKPSSEGPIIAHVKSQFPYYCQTNPIFFENAGGSQVPHQVINCMQQSLSKRHRTKIGARLECLAKQTLYQILGADSSSHNIILGSNASSLLYDLARKFSDLINPGDEIIVAGHNHEANIAPWESLARTANAKLIRLNPSHHDNNHGRDSPTDTILSQLRLALSHKTRIVALSHASNVLGHVYDIARIALTVKSLSPQARVVVDGVTSTPHRYASVGEMGVDWYVISCHKCFGPHLGVLCGTREAVREVYGVSLKLETGTVNYEACAGVYGLGLYFRSLYGVLSEGADRPAITGGGVPGKQGSNQSTSQRDDATDKLKNDDMNNWEVELKSCHVQKVYAQIQSMEWKLFVPLLSFLQSNTRVHILQENVGTSVLQNANSNRLPIVSFRHSKLTASAIVCHCENRGILGRHGSFLSRIVAEMMEDGEGVVRFSLAHYNSIEEVHTLINTLEGMDDW